MSKKPHRVGRPSCLWRECVRTASIVLVILLTALATSQLVSASPDNLQVDSLGTVPVMAIEGDGRTLWIGTRDKLFRWDTAPEGRPHEVTGLTGPVYALLRDGETLWIGAEAGLFRLSLKQDSEPYRVPNSPNSVASVLKVGARLFVRAANGLSVLEGSASEGFPPAGTVIPHVKAVTPDGIDRVWVGSDQGLYRWDGVAEPVLMPLPLSSDDQITSLSTEGSTLLIGTTKGLLRWVDAPDGQREWVFTDAGVYSLYKDPPTLLISTKGLGLRRLDEMRTGQPKTIVGDIGPSFRYFRNGNDPMLWIGAGAVAEAGLYRWNRQEPQPRRVESINTGSVFRFYKSGDTLWIGAERGLFRLDGQETEWAADLKITSDLSKVFTDTKPQVRWDVGNLGWRTTPALTQYRLIVEDEKKQEVPLENASTSGKQELTVPPLKSGTYRVYVEATDLNGKTARSAPKEFTVYRAGQNILWAKSKPFLPILIVSVVALIILSPRVILFLSRLDVLWINQLALFFYLRSLGRWKLYRRYRRRLRASDEVRYSATHYVDLPFEANVCVSEQATLPNLVTELSIDTRVVVVADGGRGKSTLCHYLADRCITKRDLFGGRHLEPVIVEGLMYGGDLFKAITNVLRDGRAYVNASIVESQLAAGNLLVLFDGYSEIREKHRDAAVEDIPGFIQQYPDTPFIITSRSSLPPAMQQVLNDPLIITLRDVDESTQRVFFAKHVEGGEKEVETLIQELEERFADLPRIPLMLKLVATVYNQKRTVPDNTAALFDEYARLVLRPEKTNVEEFIGLEYVIHHLVRETYLRSGGDRGFTMNKGVELLAQIKDKLASYDITLSPIKLLRVLIRAGLYREVRGNLRFFHDSFESYFAAGALEADFTEKRHALLKQCAHNERLSETMKFLKELITEPKERRKLNKILSSERSAT